MSRQWLSLVAAIWLQSMSGTNSNFPAYSSQLKHLLSLSQLQINNLAFASDAGKIIALFSGIAADHLPLWLVLFIGSVLGMIGYGVQYLFLNNLHYSTASALPPAAVPYWLVFVLTVLAGNSICWINTVCYILAIQNFPMDHQLALGITTSYQGLSATIYADIAGVVFSNSSSNERAKGYLLLNSILPIVASFVVTPLMVCSSDTNNSTSCSIMKSSYPCSRKLSTGFIIMFMITIATGIYAVTSSSFGYSILSSSGLSELIILIGFGVFIILMPLVVPLAEKIRESVQQKCWIRNTRVRNVPALSVEDCSDEVSRSSAVENGLTAPEKTAKEIDLYSSEEEIGVGSMLKTVNFWLYFFVYLFGATLGLVYLNNLGQIGESRGYSNTSSLVSLSSSFCFFGRLIPSLLEYYVTSVRKKYMGSRTGAMAVMMAPISGAFFVLVINSQIALCISTAIIGLCTGAISSIAVSTTTELFGTEGFAVKHNILIMNIPIGSFIFGNLAAFLYRRGGEGGGQVGRCMGKECYQTDFIIWGSLCFLGTFLALILYLRTKKTITTN